MEHDRRRKGLGRDRPCGGESAVSNIFAFLVAGFVFMGAIGAILYASSMAGTDEEPVEHAGREVSAESLAELLLSSPGVGWGAGAEGIDRLGLMADNRSGLDLEKMEALRGAYEDATAANGKVDYEEAMDSLGIEEGDFHIRVYPLGLDTALAEVDLSGIRTAYVGDWTNLLALTVPVSDEDTMLASAQVKLDLQSALLTHYEREALEAIGLGFNDNVYLEVDAPTIRVPTIPPSDMLEHLELTLVEGDVYPDIKAYLDLTLADRLAQYDLLVVGGGVNPDSFNSGSMKTAVQSFVMGGGILFVFGNDGPNQNWLNPLFSVGVETVNGAAFAPDVTHPVLHEPNTLSWTSYDTYGQAWDIKSTGSGAHYNDFTHVVVQGDEDVLAISNTGVFGLGRIFLASYRPNMIAVDLGQEEVEALLENFLLYADRTHLYLDYGAEVPGGVAVSAAVRESHVWDPTLGQVPVRIEIHYWEA